MNLITATQESSDRTGTTTTHGTEYVCGTHLTRNDIVQNRRIAIRSFPPMVVSRISVYARYQHVSCPHPELPAGCRHNSRAAKQYIYGKQMLTPGAFWSLLHVRSIQSSSEGGKTLQHETHHHIIPWEKTMTKD